MEDPGGMVERVRRLALAGMISVMFVVCGAAIASACRTTRAFDVSTIDGASTVFRGRINAYENRPDLDRAKLSFVVDKVYRGPQGVTVWDVWWQNHVFGRPKDLDEFTKLYRTDFIVGLVNCSPPALTRG